MAAIIKPSHKKPTKNLAKLASLLVEKHGIKAESPSHTVIKVVGLCVGLVAIAFLVSCVYLQVALFSLSQCQTFCKNVALNRD